MAGPISSQDQIIQIVNTTLAGRARNVVNILNDKLTFSVFFGT